MSAIASLYAISLVKFADFCKLADLVPYSQARKSDGPLVAIKVTPEMRKTAEFQKMAAKSESVQNYLERNAQSPFEYDFACIKRLSEMPQSTAMNKLAATLRKHLNLHTYNQIQWSNLTPLVCGKKILQLPSTFSVFLSSRKCKTS